MRDMRPGGGPGGPAGNSPSSGSNWRWIAVVAATILILALALSSMRTSNSPPAQPFSSFYSALNANQISAATINQDSGHITYTVGSQQYSTQATAHFH